MTDIKPEDCPTPEYHETHVYCPSCTFVADSYKPKRTFEDVYAHQLDMQVNVYGDGTPLDQFDDLRKVEFIKNNVLAALDELHEALAEVGWKPWASSRHINRDAVKGELVDVLHFYINLLGVIGVTPDELFEDYFKKAAKNKKRQEDGYDGVSTKCPGCHRALDDDAVTCVGPDENGDWVCAETNSWGTVDVAG